MQLRTVLIAASCLLGLCALTAPSCTSSDGRDALPLGPNDCLTALCAEAGAGGHVYDGGSTDGAAEATKDVGVPEVFASVHGQLGRNTEPKFVYAQGTVLLQPAKVKIFSYGKEYSSTYWPDGGWLLENVPVGPTHFAAEDIDGGNGIAPTLINAEVNEAVPNWGMVSVVPLDALTAILSGLPTPLTMNPAKAQLLITFMSCAARGGDPVSGSAVGLINSDYETVVYDGAAGGWVAKQSTGTGPNGVAIVVNLAAAAFPGDHYRLAFTFEGITIKDIEVPAAQGYVSRLAILTPC
jgi:hypothetical protein